MEATGFAEMLTTIYRITWRDIREDSNHNGKGLLTDRVLDQLRH
jgi:hypothetical protein